MADIDVGVLSLAVPPQSAPKAIYCPAVRVKNYGIQARVASGYVRVYDKFTGQLVLSFDVVSQELDAGQEGNAVSVASWDLTEAEVGKQYIVSGWCSCDGDMVPGNNVLDSSVITVADTPPPPPPPVVPHASQHEHGGDDQLNLDGLHGQPADPQPYADHASKHQDDGTDQLNISGLAGLAADPQIAADHGNERHVVPFATSSELGNHEADANTHSAAANLEQTANKGMPDGYLGLDVNGLVDASDLAPNPEATKFLTGAQKWEAAGVAATTSPILIRAGRPPAKGSSDMLVRADHQHGGEGGLKGECSGVAINEASGKTLLYSVPILAGTVPEGHTAWIRGHGCARIGVPVGLSGSITIDFEIQSVGHPVRELGPIVFAAVPEVSECGMIQWHIDQYFLVASHLGFGFGLSDIVGGHVNHIVRPMSSGFGPVWTVDTNISVYMTIRGSAIGYSFTSVFDFLLIQP